MTVGELIQELQKFDPKLEVGGAGYMGELLDINDVRYDPEYYDFVILDMDDKGENPERGYYEGD